MNSIDSMLNAYKYTPVGSNNPDRKITQIEVQDGMQLWPCAIAIYRDDAELSHTAVRNSNHAQLDINLNTNVEYNIL